MSTYVRRAIHQGADLVDGEVDHLDAGGCCTVPWRRGSCRSCEGETGLRLEGSLELLKMADCAVGRRGTGVLEENSQDGGRSWWWWKGRGRGRELLIKN